MMPQKRYYTSDDFEIGVTPSKLKRMGRDRQRDYVLHWFFSNFEDPAEQTPYNGREGGYQYVWGGPYDAREQLGDEFVDILSDARIEEFAEEIESNGTFDWAPGRNHPDQQAAAAEAAVDEEERENALPDLDWLIVQLERGHRISLGDDFERERRHSMATAAANLIEALEARRPTHGSMGHNGPPLDDEGNPLPADFVDELRGAAQVISAEAAKDVPDALAVGHAAFRLRRLGDHLKPRIGIFADEFAKKLGASAATGVVTIATIICVSLIPALHNVVAASAHWLSAILAAF